MLRTRPCTFYSCCRRWWWWCCRCSARLKVSRSTSPFLALSNLSLSLARKIHFNLFCFYCNLMYSICLHNAIFSVRCQNWNDGSTTEEDVCVCVRPRKHRSSDNKRHHDKLNWTFASLNRDANIAVSQWQSGTTATFPPLTVFTPSACWGSASQATRPVCALHCGYFSVCVGRLCCCCCRLQPTLEIANGRVHSRFGMQMKLFNYLPYNP